MITFYKLGITTIDDREGGSIYNIHYELLLQRSFTEGKRVKSLRGGGMMRNRMELCKLDLSKC